MLVRRLVAPICCALTAAALLTPHAALAGTGAASNPGSTSCSSIVSVAAAPGKPSWTAVNSAADVQCATPTVTGTATSGAPSWSSAPAAGTACTLTTWEPVTLHPTGADPQTGMGSFNSTWPEPAPLGMNEHNSTVYQPATPTPYQDPGASFPVSDSALVQGFNDVQVRYDRAGHYQAGGQCQPDPTSRWNVCEVPNAIYWGSSMAPSPCARSFLHVPAPAQQPGYGLNPIDLQRRAQSLVQGGAVNSMPQSNRGLVNLPSYFWLAGVNSAQPQTQLLRIATPPDATGRSLVYQYVVTVGLDHVEWDFGDGTRQTYAGADGLGQAWPQRSTVEHSYTTISGRACSNGVNVHCSGGTYVVTATQFYTVNVTAVWWNGAGAPVSAPLNNDSFTFPQPAGVPENLDVGQLEGVPSA